MKEDKPRVGVGVMVLKNGKVLLGKRKNAHGAGEWQFPGGHLEYMETFEECAKREAKEEAGIEIKNVKFQFLANVKKYAPKHYVHIGLTAEYKSGKVRAMEPEKCDKWEWFDLDKLPKPMFEMCKLTLEAVKKNKNYIA